MADIHRHGLIDVKGQEIPALRVLVSIGRLKVGAASECWGNRLICVRPIDVYGGIRLEAISSMGVATSHQLVLERGRAILRNIGYRQQRTQGAGGIFR